jgi:hypothetical protein
MATFTQLYLTTRTAPYTPATIRGAWDDTGGAVTNGLDSRKEWGGVITSVARAETNATTEYDVLLYRGVSGPLAAQTISGNLDVVLGVRESSTSMDGHWHLHVYVTQGDSDTPRGTLLSDYREAGGTNEWPTTAQGWALNAAQALSSLAISAGDRLVVEIGFAARNSVTTSYTGTLWYGTQLDAGGPPVNDLTAAGDETTLAGYLSFSSAITEQDVENRVGAEYVLALTQGEAGAIETRVGAEYVLALTRDPSEARVGAVYVLALLRVSRRLYDDGPADLGEDPCGKPGFHTWLEWATEVVP